MHVPAPLLAVFACGCYDRISLGSLAHPFLLTSLPFLLRLWYHSLALSVIARPFCFPSYLLFLIFFDAFGIVHALACRYPVHGITFAFACLCARICKPPSLRTPPRSLFLSLLPYSSYPARICIRSASARLRLFHFTSLLYSSIVCAQQVCLITSVFLTSSLPPSYLFLAFRP